MKFVKLTLALLIAFGALMGVAAPQAANAQGDTAPVKVYPKSTFGPCPEGWRRPFEVDPVLYPFQSNCFRHDLGLLHYVDEGPADAQNVIVFVHGNPNWSFMFHDAMSYMVAQGHRAISLDQFGFGYSDSPPKEKFGYTPREMSTILEELVVSLDLKNITLVVHDWGGPIGLGMAGRQPDRVARLVINNTTGFSLNISTEKYQGRGVQWGNIASSRGDDLIANCTVIKVAAEAEALAYDPTKGDTYKAIYQAVSARFLNEAGQPRQPLICGPTLWMPASIPNDPTYIPSVEANLPKLKGKPYTLIFAGGDQIFGEIHADMRNPLAPTCPENLTPVCDPQLLTPGQTCVGLRANPLNDAWVCRTATGGSIYPIPAQFKELLGEGSLVLFATTRYEHHWVGSHSVTRGLIRQALDAVLKAKA